MPASHTGRAVESPDTAYCTRDIALTAGVWVNRRGRASRRGWISGREGVFRAAQDGPRAIIGYGGVPRGQRPVESLRLDIRLLGPRESSVSAGGQVWDGRPNEL